MVGGFVLRHFVSQCEAWLCKTANQCCIWVSKLELVDAMEAHLEKDMTFNSIHNYI